MTKVRRKGSRSIKDIPREILNQLNMGLIETASLVEYLAVDRMFLIENVLANNKRKKYLKSISNKVKNLDKKTATTINEAINSELFNLITKYKDNEFLSIMKTHNSDIVRSWAAYVIGKNETLNIKQTLKEIQPFAADSHFCVREEAWSVVRHKIIENVECSINILSVWAKSKNENIRRFASEATRPRGVWCKHIEILKENPELALPMLELLKSDKSKYVRDSVGNWLNDASKTKPEFVKSICKKWEKESGTKETKYIIKKALRTINKQK